MIGGSQSSLDVKGDQATLTLEDLGVGIARV